MKLSVACFSFAILLLWGTSIAVADDTSLTKPIWLYKNCSFSAEPRYGDTAEVFLTLSLPNVTTGHTLNASIRFVYEGVELLDSRGANYTEQLTLSTTPIEVRRSVRLSQLGAHYVGAIISSGGQTELCRIYLEVSEEKVEYSNYPLPGHKPIPLPEDRLDLVPDEIPSLDGSIFYALLLAGVAILAITIYLFKIKKRDWAPRKF